ncbi:hypothetical protein [Methanococcoides methylutens]|uniref:hypothetical protein n=1 Tax=Methanococcoides methylutens TaxID=2226 RepID=UPI000698C659|nr:hypothetical protein [Methanococcoides methylutens]
MRMLAFSKMIRATTATIKNIYICLLQCKSLKLILCDLDLSQFPRSTSFHHPIGIVVHRDVKFGEKCIIRQNVTIGCRGLGGSCNTVLGDNVFVGPTACILGDIKIGNGAKIGAGAIVLKDVPEGATVTGVWK